MDILVAVAVIFNLKERPLSSVTDLCRPHLEIQEGHLWSSQVELELLAPGGTEPVVPHWLGLLLVGREGVVLLVSPDPHLHVRVHHLPLLAVVGPGDVLPGEDLHVETEAGEERPVQTTRTAGAVVEYRLSRRQTTLVRPELLSVGTTSDISA